MTYWRAFWMPGKSAPWSPKCLRAFAAALRFFVDVHSGWVGNPSSAARPSSHGAADYWLICLQKSHNIFNRSIDIGAGGCQSCGNLDDADRSEERRVGKEGGSR